MQDDQPVALRLWNRLYSAWKRTDISHRGAYTARRARALEHYCHSTSLSRVLAVCFLTPLPILCFVLAMELLPLNAPSDGWRSNSGWVVRYVFVFNLLSLCCLQQASSFLTTLNITLGQGLAIAWITVSCYFVVLLTIMAVWVFPIPFVFELTGGVFGAVFMGCVVMILGRQTIAKTPQARVLYYVSAVEAAMCFVYPVFSAVYHVLNGIQQLALIIFLYVLKVFTRLSMAHACCSSTDEEDRLRSLARLPERVVFTANLFHLVYLMTCLQGARMSIWTIGTLVSIDTFTSVLSVKRLIRRPAVVLICTLPKEGMAIKQSRAAVVPLNGPPVTAIPIKLSIVSRMAKSFIVRVVDMTLVRRSLSRISGHSSSWSVRSSPRSRIVPSQQTELSERRRPEPISKPRDGNVVRFQTLSMAEYFILVKYVSCIIPVMVGVYTSILARLPNAVYYPALAGTTANERKASQFDVAVYAMLQILSLIAFELILRRRLQYSVLHQLGFVLETASADIQAKLGMFIPYCFFFFLDHNGVDFSFQFAWMN
ncbi:hypothetical protein PPTG_06673 [Phytophthora nicotianae INRA-310]|uniref:Uncharacterized protein n=1 Tax=Phytophthora nicotianae (strain INRA-310) TaxID=761204 RepID=W2QSD2_PHYN3|nr:hypothetical protein PPTG_06673 [Phytophthora nicotianae INRA-310]ETN15399.1 hypothetical protein PPTG_06673 [Phytophthora nicotianae INRA-310]